MNTCSWFFPNQHPTRKRSPTCWRPRGVFPAGSIVRSSAWSPFTAANAGLLPFAVRSSGCYHFTVRSAGGRAARVFGVTCYTTKGNPERPAQGLLGPSYLMDPYGKHPPLLPPATDLDPATHLLEHLERHLPPCRLLAATDQGLSYTVDGSMDPTGSDLCRWPVATDGRPRRGKEHAPVDSSQWTSGTTDPRTSAPVSHLSFANLKQLPVL